MSDLLFNKAWKVTAWREEVPKTPWNYQSKRLEKGEQVELTEHRIKFKITRDLTKKPNKCDLHIYNLSPDHRSDFETLPLSVQIEAGYDKTPRLLFLGDLRFGRSEIKNSTWDTLCQLGDGSRAYKHARANRSYKPGTTYRVVITEAAKSMGLALPENIAANPELDRQFEAGTTSYGFSRDELTRLLAPFGYHWTVQNGQLRVLRDDEVHTLEAIPVDREHGMIDQPHFGTPSKAKKSPALHVKTLLYPELVPGDLIQLTSNVKTGLYRADRVEHTGDSHQDGDWLTELELKPF